MIFEEREGEGMDKPKWMRVLGLECTKLRGEEKSEDRVKRGGWWP